MKRPVVVLLLSACLVLGNAGCATMFSPGPDLIPVSSKPPGATVRLDGMEMGRTPMVVPVSRTSEGVFTFELSGYETKKVDRDKVVNGATFLNLGWIILWPAVPVAFLIDAATSNIGKYSVAPLRVELTPLPSKS